MKKTATATLATAALLVGAATTASPMKGMFNDAFGTPAETVTRADIELDAVSLFQKVDVDQSGTLSIDEFAAQSVVLAELARFNRTVSIEGEEDMQIAVPGQIAKSVGLTERSSIDAVARRAYHHATAGDEMTQDEFVTYRVHNMTKADVNRDGRLAAYELELFASAVAQPAQARS